MKRFHNIWLCCFMVSSVLFISCNESLPVREDMTKLFMTSISSAFHRESGQNYFRFYITVKNMTDETIEERASFNGTFEITWIPSTDGESPGVNKKRTIHFDRTNIFRSTGYDASTGVLRLAPLDSIMFFVHWNMRSNDSSFLPTYWGAISDFQCNVQYYNNDVGVRRISKSQQLMVSANVKLYEKLSILHSAPAILKRCYVANYRSEVNPPQNPCTNINIVDPCIIIEE